MSSILERLLLSIHCTSRFWKALYDNLSLHIHTQSGRSLSVSSFYKQRHWGTEGWKLYPGFLKNLLAKVGDEPRFCTKLRSLSGKKLKTQFHPKICAKIRTQLTCFSRELVSKILVGSCIHAEEYKKGRNFPGNMEI